MQKIPTMSSLKNKPFPFNSILQWYRKNGRHDLPWRQAYVLPVKDMLYQVWIAEVMLQQTQVDRVVSYYERFLSKYPSIESLANTTYEELFPYWQGLGYYSRARRMIELARIIVEKYDGVFPDDFEKLWKLPWIGQYTAQALLAFGYNKSILAIDANLEKIFARYYLGTRYADKKILEALTEKLQKQVQNEAISGRDINNALMDFWALISTTFDKVDKHIYPLPECMWFQTEGKEEIYEKKVRKQKLKNTYSCLVFLHENHTKYWSSHQKYYEPFLIEAIGKDDRKSIQDYFSATYDLEVSVRPSFWNAQYGDLHTKLFHAQIQTWNISFPTFPKEEKKRWEIKNIFNS